MLELRAKRDALPWLIPELHSLRSDRFVRESSRDAQAWPGIFKIVDVAWW